MPPISRKRRAPANEESETTISFTQQRNQQRASPDDEDDSVEEEQGNGSGSLNQLSKGLVRYALACEYSRMPIKRQDINQKVLGSHSRAFKHVFAAANAQLVETFGMEMVELPNREKVTVRQKRAAAASESQAKTSNQWVLTNALPPKYRVPEIIAPPRIPTLEVESAYVGLYTLIVALISLSGGSLPENKLERYLKRMNADQSTPVDRTDKLLARMIKEGYIVKIKDSSAGEEIVDYMVGPRGKVEVGDDAIMGFVKTVYGDGAMEDLEQRVERSLGIAERRVPSQTQRAVNGNGEAGPSTQTRRPGRPRRRSRSEQERGEESE
ncbi:MAGE-domain-containing protein [Zopfia rhizophila CBS 207.26]|uniref:MAGE-domain-containing protein n=1 Tax=Zopfia rhizophila CBS 207.26 TaxID=1314779 RepID=A0A6A6DVH4_9PEZI|nr:MAGE-domain-containing protein [Zopfia rhizophila CBS 207.26]